MATAQEVQAVAAISCSARMGERSPLVGPELLLLSTAMSSQPCVGWPWHSVRPAIEKLLRLRNPSHALRSSSPTT
eukprot:scaffold268305_cov32-Tisochrysis_lutea.AAC.3